MKVILFGKLGTLQVTCQHR